MTATKRITSRKIHDATDLVVRQIVDAHAETETLAVVGIADGGIEFGRRIAEALEKHLKRKVPFGVVNASFHRDDLDLKPIPKDFHPTDVPFDVDNTTLILADDVLFSGRTARAALNELFDQGRPKRVEIAILCRREGQLLPIHARFIGFEMNVSEDSKVIVSLSPDDPAKDALTIEEK